MKRSMARSVLFSALLLTISILSGCGGDDENGGGSSGLEKKTIKVGLTPVTGVAPFFVGQQAKVFEAEGLKVEPVMLTGADKGVPLLAKGDLDVLFGNHVTFIQAQQSNVFKIRILAEANETAKGNVTILTKKGSKIASPKDLEGKKCAILIRGGWQELTLNATVRSGGGDPSKLQYLAMPLPNMGPALQRGDIDCEYTGEPFVSTDQAKYGFEQNIDPVAGPVEKFPLSGYYATQQFIDKNPKTAAAFQRGQLKAQSTAAADRAKVISVIPTFTKIDAKLASTITLDGFPTSVNPVRLQRVIDAMKNEGVLKQPLDAKQLIFTAPQQ